MLPGSKSSLTVCYLSSHARHYAACCRQSLYQSLNQLKQILVLSHSQQRWHLPTLRQAAPYTRSYYLWNCFLCTLQPLMMCLLAGKKGNCSKSKSHAPQVGARQDTPAYRIADLKPGHRVPGPAILIDEISTVVVEPQCTAFVTAGIDIRIEVGESEDEQDTLSTTKCDPIQLAIFSHR